MTEFGTFEGLKIELRADGVGLVLLDRPEKLNAVTSGMLQDFARALRALGASADCGAVVIAGAGSAFSAGMDLTGAFVPEGTDPVQQVFAGMRVAVDTVLAIRDIPQPVIAAVRGPAVGAGFAMTAAADLRICAADAIFLAPFLKLGVSVGDMGLSWMLPRLIGAGAAAEVLYTGAPLGADDAHRLGFVQRIVDDPVATAVDMAGKIAHRPRLAVQMSKDLLNASIGAGGLREHLELEMRSQVIGLLSEDHRKALRDFAARQR